MLDLVIRGGRVVTPSGVENVDLGIVGERFVEIGAYGTMDDRAARTIDATDMLVVPGGIDPHVHCSWPVTEGEKGSVILSAGAASASSSALWGGTTTLVDFALVRQGDTIEKSVEETQSRWRGESSADYAFHVMLLGDVEEAVIESVPESIRAGLPSYKMFTTNVRPHVTGRMVPFGKLVDVLETVARAGGIASIHAEDDDLVMRNYEKHFQSGRTHFQYLPDVHSALSEDLSFRRVLRAAMGIEGAALYMMHVSAKEGVEAVAEAKALGLDVVAETLHQYACFTREVYTRKNGQIFHTYPAIRDLADGDALWAGLADGTVDTVATDGLCTPLEVKLRGNRIDDVTGGNVGVEPRMAVVYTEGVVKRGLSLERFVRVTSENAARALGLYPQKGAIAIGSDADITILRTGIDKEITAADFHESDYTPWEGVHVNCWPEVTILRGQVMVSRGDFVGKAGAGRWISAKRSTR